MHKEELLTDEIRKCLFCSELRSLYAVISANSSFNFFAYFLIIQYFIHGNKFEFELYLNSRVLSNKVGVQSIWSSQSSPVRPSPPSIQSSFSSQPLFSLHYESGQLESEPSDEPVHDLVSEGQSSPKIRSQIQKRFDFQQQRAEFLYKSCTVVFSDIEKQIFLVTNEKHDVHILSKNMLLFC